MPQFIGPTDVVLPKSLLLAGIHYAEGIVWLVVVSMIVEQTRRFAYNPRSGDGWTVCAALCESVWGCVSRLHASSPEE